ncbi:MAG: hypothetical protein KatS3mg122_2597 [Caldimonas sp.]|uniref:NfeD family protein n=1 Tax=Caldimonas taiwanensis TaxID=307483 RepID=UPI0007817601|nr:NfeD family protein [Caldimonas taiwanensis]GIX25366.1 MAG: hypothetical protein KatS3mg122_2597 [Caldimonas sp.]
MGFQDATWWWLLAGLAVVFELLTGTFYLLMMALGLAAGAVAAHAGLGWSGQLVAAAVVGGGAVALWRGLRGRHPRRNAQAEPEHHLLDIGERVSIEQWRPDQTARVHYRGTLWTARYAGTGTPEPGIYTIRAVEGHHLLVDR